MKDFLLEEESYQIFGRCMEIHAHLGGGFSEIVYKDALELEFKQHGIPYEREVEYSVKYKGTVLPHKFYADFVVFGQIILEAKTVSEFHSEHYNQVLNYLKVSGSEIGLLVNFKNQKLQYKRVILTDR